MKSRGWKVRWVFRAALLTALVILIAEFIFIAVKTFSNNSDYIPDPTVISLDKIRSNLDSMSMPTRRVQGRSEPCLKLLDEEQIAELDFPPVHESDLEYVESTGEAVTNRFTGKQTMVERNSSFQVGTRLHCGFYQSNAGFDMDDQDRQFLSTCEAVVTTCIFGGGDELYVPIGRTNTSLSKVCYVAFWDEVTLVQMPEENRPKEDRVVNGWRVVVVRNLPFIDQRKNGKIPKMLGHRLFPRAKFSIWVDSKYQFRRDPMGVFHELLWSPQASIAISQHGARKCVYREGVAVVAKNKALPADVDFQLSQYKREGFPENATLDGHKALAEASVIVREHSVAANRFMCLWFNEVVRYTARDQLSFPYVLLRFQQLRVNMFPVCTRKALVNSIGHKQKAKQLVDVFPEE